MSVAKKSKSRIALLIAIPCVILSLTLFIGKSSAADSFITKKIEEIASEKGVEAKLEDLSISPLDVSVSLSSISLSSTAGDWKFSSGKIKLTFHPLSSLSGRPTFSLEIEDPLVYGKLPGKESGDTGLLARLKGYDLKKFSVKNASVVVDLSENLSLNLDGASADYSGGAGKAEIRGGKVKWRGNEEKIKTLSVTGRSEGGEAWIEALELESDRVRISSSAKISASGALTGEVKGTANLEKLPPGWLSALGLANFAPVGGKGVFEGKITGTGKNPRVEGRLTVTGGEFSTCAIPAFSTGAVYENKVLEFKGLKADTCYGALGNFGGKLDFNDGVKLSASGDFENYDLRGSMRILPGFRDGNFPVTLFASGKLSAQGTLAPNLSLNATLSAKVRDFDVATKRNGTFTSWYGFKNGTLDTRCRIGSERIIFYKSAITADSLTLAIPGGSVDYPTGLEFETDLAIRDLSTVRRYLPEGFDASGKAVGTFGGPYSALKFNYDLDLDKTVILGENLGRLKAKASYDLRTLETGNLTVDGAFGKIEAAGKAILTTDGSYDLDLKWQGGELSKLLAVVRKHAEVPPIDLSGKIYAEGRLGGKLKTPVFKGEVTVGSFTSLPWWWLKKIDAEAIRVAGEFSLDSILLSSFEASAYGASWHGSGKADKKTFDVKAGVTGFDVAKLPGILPAPDGMGGVAYIDVTGEGTFKEPSATAIGTVENARVLGEPVGDVKFEAHFLKGRARLNAWTIDGQLDLAGEMGIDGVFSVTAEAKELGFDRLPLERFLGNKPPGFAARSITGRGTVEGSLKEGKIIPSSIGFTGIVGGAEVKGFPLEDVEIAVNYPQKGPDGSRVMKIDGSAVGKTLWVSVLHPMESKKPIEVSGTAVAFPVSRLGKLYEPLKGGILDAEFSLRAVPGENGEVNLASVEIQKLSGEVRELTVEPAGKLPDFVFSGATGEGKNLHLSLKAEGLELQEFSLNQETLAWKGRLALNNFRSEAVGGERTGFSGSVSGWAQFSGVSAKPGAMSGEGTFSAEKVPGINPFPGGWKFSGDAEALFFEAGREPGVSLRGVYNPEKGLSAVLTLEKTPVEDWLVQAEGQKPVTGSVTGRVELGMPAGGAVSAKADFQEVLIKTEYAEVKNREEVHLTWDDGTIGFKSLILTGDGFDLSLSGKVKAGSFYDLRASGKMDLRLFSGQLPGLEEASGVVVADGLISGSWEAPVYQGFFEIPGSSMVKLKNVPYPFSDIRLKASFEGTDTLYLENLEAKFAKGTIHGEGLLKLEKFKPAEMKIFVEARDIDFEYPKDVRYQFGGDFLVTGKPSAPEVRGEVKLAGLLYRQRFNWRTSMLDLIRSQKREAAVGVQDEERVFVDIALLGADNLRVENNVGEFSFQVDLRVRGYLPSPELMGEVSAKDGFVRFRAHEYQLLRSSIEFLGDLGSGTLIDAAATTTVGQYTVNVSATGTLDDSRVELSSVPPLQRQDIIALLALGTTSENVSTGDVTAFEAGSFLTGGIQDELENQANEVLGVDQFHIDPAFSQTMQTTVPRVTVGKALGESLYARYGVLMGTQSEQEMSLEYTVKSGVLVSGSWSDQGKESQGSFGGEIRFRITFR